MLVAVRPVLLEKVDIILGMRNNNLYSLSRTTLSRHVMSQVTCNASHSNVRKKFVSKCHVPIVKVSLNQKLANSCVDIRPE
jgi:hypothetical protein